MIDEEEERDPLKPWTMREIDEALVAAGWPPVSPWWWALIDKVYGTNMRNIVVRGGRRGGKSSTLAGRIAVYELLSDKHVVPSGDFGYFAILSADKDQAQERLETCHKALDVLGVRHRKTANEITLVKKNVGVKAFAATTTAVVSFTSIGFLCDEMARWRDKDSAANPAKEIVTSLRPTMATMPNARGWYVSAPWSTLDLHHEMVMQGDTVSQLVFSGTTPEMNPTLDDARIIELEPDEPTRRREYYVEPMGADSTKFFGAEFIDAAATAPMVPKQTGLERAPWEVLADNYRVTAGGDFAFRRDSSAVAVLAQVAESYYKLQACDERVPGVRALVPSVTITDLTDMAITHGATSIACDLHYIETVREVVDELEIELMEYPSDENEKWYVRLRVLLSQGRIDLRGAPKSLLDQLKAVTARPLDGGRLKIEVKRSEGLAHGDSVSALVCAIWAMDQAAPLEKMTFGQRRFSRGEKKEPPHTFHDRPPTD